MKRFHRPCCISKVVRTLHSQLLTRVPRRWYGTVCPTTKLIHTDRPAILSHQYRHFATRDTASYSVDDCPYLSFAKEHADAAQSVLRVPPISLQRNSLHPFSSVNNGNNDAPSNDTLESYIEWRGWDVKGTLQQHKLGDELVPSAVGLLSHTLTFPLTLGRHINHINSLSSPTSSHQLDNDDDDQSFRICCVGARAECTLPDDFWKEFLIAHINKANGNQDKEESLNCTIDFVGPDVPIYLNSKKITLSDNEKEGTNEQHVMKHELTMNYHTCVLHDVVLKFLKSAHASANKDNDGTLQSSSDRVDQIRQIWDGFVLYNPGIGHPNLAKLWKPTIKFILSTGKPVLFTAHSELDAERDRVVLEELLESTTAYNNKHGQPQVQYTPNPYASRMNYVDPISSRDLHVVRPNHSVFLLQ